MNIMLDFKLKIEIERIFIKKIFFFFLFFSAATVEIVGWKRTAFLGITSERESVKNSENNFEKYT